VLYASPLLLAGVLLALVLASPLNAVVLGRHTAAALGVRHQYILLMALLAMTLLIGTSTALTGPIGFIGLMIPHLARWLVGQDQRRMMLLACLLAPLLLLAADILGRFMLTNGIRVAVVTALIGAPVMIYLIRRPVSSPS
jgi:iron complex transport system permease protein